MDDMLAPGLFPHLAASFVAVHLRQADVEQNDMAQEFSRRCDGLFGAPA
jgi:hypothetical protein